MKKLHFLSVFLFLFVGSLNISYSQGFLRKLQDKAEDKAIDKIFEDKKKDQTSNSDQSQSSQNSQSSSNTMSNTKGGGLNNSAPDVKENIKSAGTSFDAKNYSDARYSVRQAIMGIELEIGKNILKSLPETVKGLKMNPDDDQVTSSGIGFAGLTINRTYESKDQQLKLTIANDAVMLSAINMYLSGSYATANNNNNENNWKQVKYKDYRGVLQYDESSGYTLSVPFGQNSLFMVNGLNFASENDIMSAAQEFDLDKIKKELGEQ